MEERELYSVSEVIDNIDSDLVFVSLYPLDEGAAFKLNERNFLTVRYPKEEEFTVNINLRYYNDIKIKRYVKMTLEEFDIYNKSLLEENDGI